MQKVVLDTNVLVSSLIQHGYPYFIVYELVGEYYEVLTAASFQGILIF